MPRILVVDDNAAVCTALEILFDLQGIEVESVDNPQAALARVERGGVDLVIQDMNFSRDTTSGEEGVALFGELRRREPDLPIILLTAWTHLETAVELVKQGAADYVTKPFEVEALRIKIRQLLEHRALEDEVARLRRERGEPGFVERGNDEQDRVGAERA